MQINFRGLLLLLTTGLFIALSGTYIATGRIRADNLLLILPGTGQQGGVTYERLNETVEEKFLLTYQVYQQRSVEVINKRHSVIVRGTNHMYPFVMSYTMLSGGYFPKNSAEQKLRHAVLNELAAFEMYGGADIVGNEITIDNTVYLIMGVVNDGDEENKNVYIPIAHFNESPDSFMAMTDDGNGISAEFIQNEFKQVGVTEYNYDFVNLNTLKRVIRERTILAFALAVLIVLLYLIIRVAARLHMQIRSVRGLMKQYYFKRLLNDEWREVMHLAATGSVAAALAGVWIWLFLWAAEILLGWRVYAGMPQIRSSVYFENMIQSLQSAELFANIFFSAFVIVSLLFSVYYFRDR